MALLQHRFNDEIVLHVFDDGIVLDTTRHGVQYVAERLENVQESAKTISVRMGSSLDSMEDVRTISKALQHTTIEEIRLSQCRLGTSAEASKMVGDALTQSNVILIDLSDNDFGVNPKAIEAIGEVIQSKQATINLSCNDIGSHIESVSALAASLSESRSPCINLSSNNIGSNPEAVVMLAVVFADTAIGSVDLSNNQLFASPDNTPEITTIVANTTADLNLSNNPYEFNEAGILGFISVLNAVRDKQTNAGVCLSACKLGANRHVAHALAATIINTKAKAIDISDNGLGKDNEVASNIATAVQTAINIEEINLSGNQFGSCVYASEKLKSTIAHTNIRTFNLSRNGFYENTAATQEIASGIKHTKVKNLDISGNDLGINTEAARFILAALQPDERNGLEHVNLSGNKLGASREVAIYLMRTLRESHIASLDLTDNDLGSDYYVAERVELGLCSTQVKRINLSRNNFADSRESAQALARMIEDAPVDIIDISDNGFGEPGTGEQDIILGEALARSSSKKIILGGQEIGPGDKESLAAIQLPFVRDGAIAEYERSLRIIEQFVVKSLTHLDTQRVGGHRDVANKIFLNNLSGKDMDALETVLEGPPWTAREDQNERGGQGR